MAEEETFKVTDRRRRDESEETPPAAAATSLPGAASGAPSARPASPGPSTSPPAGPDLQGLFIMLATSALMNLGEAADPETGERVLDLGQAKEAIDLLSLLKLKTEGNRTDQESHLLEEMLYDLQMRFVRAAKGPSGT
jgi:hypothetical protein